MKEAPVRDSKLYEDKQWFTSWTVSTIAWTVRILPFVALAGGYGIISKIWHPTAWKVLSPAVLTLGVGMEYYDIKFEQIKLLDKMKKKQEGIYACVK